MTTKSARQRLLGKATSDLPLVVVAKNTNKTRKRKAIKVDVARYQYDTERYIVERMGWTPWGGGGEKAPGQREIIDAYTLALRQLHERSAYEKEEIDEADLQYWKPGEVIQNWIRVEAGHTVGKTKVSSGLVNHFFDCFAPSIIYTYAPSREQIHDLLWKEIKSDRRDKGLPGRILDLELRVDDNHFAKGKATDNANGTGTERAQGQHGKYLMFVLDEAEGIPEFVYNAVKSMASGGICIVLMLANPKSRSSKFHKIRKISNVKNFRMSCINHPNVIAGREIIPGAVQRDYVLTMMEEHCQVLEAHNPDDHTFDVPFDVTIAGKIHPAGTVFKPNSEFMFRVLGIAPANITDNTLVPVGRYEAACSRTLPDEATTLATMGVDVAGFGKDYGTLYIRRGMKIRRAAQFWQLDYDDYARVIRAEALKLKAAGVTHLHIRVDAGGGFGNGVVSHLKLAGDLKDAFPGDHLKFIMVHFGAPAHDTKAYGNCVTEMYAQAAETIKGIAIEDAPNELEIDLCERTYDWVNRSGVEVKELQTKKVFKKTAKHSPDDGDGFVLCAAPAHIFVTKSTGKTAPVRPMVYGINR